MATSEEESTQEKVAFVTGAASGIGRAAALAFAGEGANVAVADVSEQGNQETARMIEQRGGRALAVRCDVTRAEDVKSALQKTVEAFRRLDMAFNNAGIEPRKPAPTADYDEEEWNRIIDIDLHGVMCSQYERIQMNNQHPHSKDNSNPPALDGREKTMKERRDADEAAQSRPPGPSRRDFLVSAATAVASVGAANLLDLQLAEGANAKNSVAIGDGPYPTEGMAAYSPTGPHKLMKFQRRALGPEDVAIKIRYCGVCHSDIHMIRGDWGKIQYPQIVGHELAGEVVAVGSSVSKFTVGARVGVGTMVNSCRICTECQAGHENCCLNGNTQTYGSKDRDGTITQGGYSTFVVVNEDFVINIPEAIDLSEAGPLLCAGITVYSPLRRWGVSPGKKVAVVGMGGLGHLAVKLATALGAEVTVFTTSPDKIEDAKRFGAREVLINEHGSDFSKQRHAFDFALDTVPYKHDLNRFIPLLKRDAAYCRVGVGKVVDSHEIGQMNLVLYRNALAGSNTGGIRETQDMIDFCALNGIKPEITRISMNGIDDAWKEVVAKQGRYRFVMDMGA